MNTKLLKIEKMANDLIKYYSPEYSFKWGNGNHVYGYCSYNHMTITISKPLASINSEDETLNTILHEIAHALTQGEHHNLKWQEVAKSIGNTGSRCYDATVQKPSKTWVGECPKCFRQVFKYRRAKTSCGKCDKRFNPSLLFKWSKIELKEVTI